MSALTAAIALLVVVSAVAAYDVIARRVECSLERNLEPLDRADGAAR